MNKRRPACKRGHDRARVGRYNGTRDGYGPCKACNLINAAESKARRMAFLTDYKTGMGCKMCGYNRCGRALDLHHRDPSTKLFSIAARPMAPMPVLLAEIAKCDVICKNCHQEYHSYDHD